MMHEATENESSRTVIGRFKLRSNSNNITEQLREANVPPRAKKGGQLDLVDNYLIGKPEGKLNLSTCVVKNCF